MKKKFYCKILFFTLLPFILLGQNKNNFNNLSYDELRNTFLSEENNNQKKILIANAYLNKAKEENEDIQIARAYYMFAMTSFDNDDNKAIEYLDKAILYSKDLNDKGLPAVTYFQKARILQKQLRYKEAVNCFILAEKDSKYKNPDYSYIVKLNLAVIKSENLGEVDEAMILYKECYNYYRANGCRKPKYSGFYQEILFDLADAYKAKKQIDSSTYYNKLGYIEAKYTKDEEMLNLFILNEGANQAANKNYKTALDSIKKALPKMISYKNEGNTLAGYYYLGKVYQGLNNKEKAIKNYKLVDSIYHKTKNISPEFVSGYNYLINYYKNNGDKNNQLKYLTTFMSIDSTMQKSYKEIYKSIHKDYEVPNLIKEKEELISSLKGDKKYSYWGIGILIFTVIGLSSFIYYQLQQKKKDRARFEKIIAEINNPTVYKKTEIVNSYNKKELGISEEQANHILNKLKAFESKKDFLNSAVTAQSLSQEFDTNSTYLSKVINHYKGKNFSQYLNDLRIDYAIINIQNDKDLKKYTISALANEFGYNAAESFSSAFYKKTGIKPSYFIKELEKK